MMGFIPENVIVIDAYIAQDGRRIYGPVETEEEVNIYITVPEEYVNRPFAAGTNTRLYTVTMWHDANNNGQIDEGEIEVVLRDGTINDKNQLAIKSDKFSYFVISSRDVYRGSGSKEFIIPNTGITVSGLVSGIGYISLTAFVVFALLALKKKLINSK